jgi:hypothetical protein
MPWATTLWALASWIAVIIGLAGTWHARNHRTGWLLGTLCCLLWVGYDIVYGIWAGLFSAALGVGINLRNYLHKNTPH